MSIGTVGRLLSYGYSRDQNEYEDNKRYAQALSQ